MARSVRIEFPSAYYRLMVRGNRREAIFLDADDRRFFPQCLAEACEKTGWRVHAWVLMASHYHLFIETPEANLVEGMKWLQNTVTRRFNVRHRKWGRLFGDGSGSQNGRWSLQMPSSARESLVPTREAASGSPTAQRRPRNS